MPKRDLLHTIDQRLAVRNGEFASASGSVVQIGGLALGGTFTGDLQITGQGRLIVGDHPDLNQRLVVSQNGLFGYNDDGTNTFSIYTRATGDNTAGDVFAGMPDGNYLLYDQSESTLGLYSAAGAGFIASGDGSLWAGDMTGAHMHWSSERKAFEIRNGEDVKISLDANGDGFFDGTVYAQGGKIYGDMWVDGLLRLGDVDGPQITIGKFSRTNANVLVETGEIIASDANNLPWFHVTAGGTTAGGGWFHLGGSGDYAERLTYDGTSLVIAGKVYADAFVLSGGGVIQGGSTMTNAGKFTAGVNQDVAVIDGEDATWRIYAGSATPIIAPFRVNQSGEVWLDNAHVAGVIQVGGTAGGWTIAADYLAKDTGTDSTSAGMAPLDYPFFAGATYANRANALFRVTPLGAFYASVGTIADWNFTSGLMYYGSGSSRAGMWPSVGYPFFAGGEDPSLAPLRVTLAGAFTATSATITGAITATSGTIGSFTIGTYLYTGSKTAYNDANAGVHIGGDGIGIGNNVFTVSSAGALTATSATITGAITATSGSITGSLYVGASAPRIHIDGANKYIESTNYASGTAGFRITGADGNAEFNNITARGEIVTSVFRKGQVIATSGSIYVTRSASIVTEACTATATTFTLKVKKQLSAAPFAAGEIVRIHGEASDTSTWAVVNAGSDGTDHWAYTCYYQSGSNSATYVIGCAVLGYGPAIVANSTIANAATATATTFTLDVNEIGAAKPFDTGSYVLLVEGGSSTVCTIDAGADQGAYWRYTATYISGSNSNVYNASSPVFALGTAAPSDGRTMITSDATNSPYISVATHAAQPWTTMTEKVRLGNLTGISGASGYGLWTDNGYFTGTVNAGGGAIVIDSAGVMATVSTTSGGATENSYKFKSGSTETSFWRVYDYGTYITSYFRHSGISLSRNAATNIDTLTDGTGYSANTNITSSYSSNQPTIGLQAASAISAINMRAATLTIDGNSGLNKDVTATIYGWTTVNQGNTTAAIPVLTLTQTDVSEEMIEFTSTAGTGNAIEAVGAKTLTTTHFIKVTVNGDTRYIPVGTIA